MGVAEIKQVKKERKRTCKIKSVNGYTTGRST
jgi:hypothetical protein